jgi:hypothetical protein
LRVREFCGTRSCFVVLRPARLWISNGHPASVIAKNQFLAIAINANPTLHQKIPFFS